MQKVLQDSYCLTSNWKEEGENHAKNSASWVVVRACWMRCE